MSEELRTTKPDLKGFLEKHIGSVQAVAAATLNPERMARLVCAAVSRNEKLAACTQMSILRAMAEAASMGLEPFDGRSEVHLVPRWNKKANGGKGAMEATCLPDFRGLIRLATDTGKVRNVEARIVREKDVFEVEQGDSPKLTHKISAWGKDRGAMVGVYAVAFYTEGGSTFDTMSIQEVEDIRDRSKDKDGFSPWKTDFEEMARKTAVRRLSKYLPKKSVEFGRALEIQAKTEAGEYFDGEVIRPGDANVSELGSSKVDGLWEWSEEDKTSFLNACGDLQEACIKAGLSESETDAKIGLYQEQKRSGEVSPETVIKNIYLNCDRTTKKVPA